MKTKTIRIVLFPVDALGGSGEKSYLVGRIVNAITISAAPISRGYWQIGDVITWSQAEQLTERDGYEVEVSV